MAVMWNYVSAMLMSIGSMEDGVLGVSLRAVAHAQARALCMIVRADPRQTHSGT